jgi:hypothetical protein
MITPEEMLRLCQAYGRAGRFVVSERAHARSREQGHSQADLVHALTHAIGCERAEEALAKWIVRGPSLDGAEMALFVVLAAGVLSVV